MEKVITAIIAAPVFLFFTIIGLVVGAIASCLVLIGFCLLGLILVPIFLLLGLVFGAILACGVLS